MNAVFVILLVLVLGASVTAGAIDARATDGYYDLGDFERAVTTHHPEAARWFARGLVLCYGFNHEEAVRCFERAAELDPALAMAHWGIAYALGPNINNPVMDEAASRRAYEATQAARERQRTASPVEQALIQALEMRYAWPAPEDRAPLDHAYADAMRQVYRTHPDDVDVAALFAEALLDLRPWKLWTPAGDMAPETPEIVAVLEKALARWPKHPALCHFYIHTMEASTHPGKALAAADQLRDLVPEAGHLVHMPAHIDMLLGRYEHVIAANQKAIAVDRKFVEHQGRLNFYTLYRVHSFHFLVYGAMFDGQQKLALEAARELVREIPAELLAQIPDFVEAFLPSPLHVLVRFGRWQEILSEPAPPVDQHFPRSMWHYARTLAHATGGRVREASAELDSLTTHVALIPDTRLLFNNTCADVARIALAMARGELEYRRDNVDAGFAHLQEAVRLDDGLNYDEPWGWMQPARHALGALLLEQDRVTEAEAVFRADLERHPNNGWSLHGLEEALGRRGETVAATQCHGQLQKAWQRADTALDASCFCRVGKAQN